MTLEDALARIWEECKPSTRGRLEAIEAAAAELERGGREPTVLAEGLRAAHQLAGSLGTFGMPEGSEIGAALEAELGREPPDAAAVDALARRLRVVLDPRLT